MVGGVFDRFCNGEKAGCTPAPGGGWLEGQTLKNVSYLTNGAHFGSRYPACCSCCRPHGFVCPHGYDPEYELDTDGKYTTQPPTLLGCRSNPAGHGFGQYWIGQTLVGNTTRCYCGCCPCTPDELAFSVIKAEIIIDEGHNPRSVSNAKKELDAWSFELKGLKDPCYETQEMGQYGYLDRCGHTTPVSWNTLAGVCNGAMAFGDLNNTDFGTDPEYTQEGRKAMYIESYGYDGKICKENADAPIPDRPAFPFFNAENEGMSIVAALCCCKTGNEVEVPELPYNWDGAPEDDVPTPSQHVCPAEKGLPFQVRGLVGAQANPVNFGILAACPSENAGIADEATFHHNGPDGGLNFPIDSHTH